MEMAFLLMLFLTILFGILDIGQVLFFHHLLCDRVRVGVRYAVVHSYDTAAIRNVVAFDNPAGPRPGGSGLFGLTPAMVQVEEFDAGTPSARIQVGITTFPIHFVSPWLPHIVTPGPFQAVMPVESGGTAE